MKTDTRYRMLLVGWITLITGCQHLLVTRPAGVEFAHDLTGEAVPWTHRRFDNAPDKFTFAVFSDLTGGERNRVFSIAMEQLRLLRPELIVSVGDLIEGDITDEAALDGQWDSFDQRAARARAPVFRVGGNHDLGNPVMWKVWEARHGQRYYYFIYRDVLFLVLDTEDNPEEFQSYMQQAREEAMETVRVKGWGALPGTEYGQLEELGSGRIGREQADYFLQVLDQHPDVRWTFLLMHKPAWERPGEENFARIETALDDRPYTVFHGHVHSYLHQIRHGRDYIRLGTTGGVHIRGNDASVDHVTLVTVSGEGVDIANLRLSGIFDKTGKIPLGGGKICLENCYGE